MKFCRPFLQPLHNNSTHSTIYMYHQTHTHTQKNNNTYTHTTQHTLNNISHTLTRTHTQTIHHTKLKPTHAHTQPHYNNTHSILCHSKLKHWSVLLLYFHLATIQFRKCKTYVQIVKVVFFYIYSVSRSVTYKLLFKDVSQFCILHTKYWLANTYC